VKKKDRLFGKKMAVNKNNFNLLEFVLFWFFIYLIFCTQVRNGEKKKKWKIHLYFNSKVSVILYIYDNEVKGSLIYPQNKSLLTFFLSLFLFFFFRKKIQVKPEIFFFITLFLVSQIENKIFILNDFFLLINENINIFPHTNYSSKKPLKNKEIKKTLNISLLLILLSPFLVSLCHDS